MEMEPSKLLIIDPKPKSAPPNSASSSSTTNTPPLEKRTRNQPNLSDCHCCGRRINHTNPNDRLQPLNSFWRIVLLCRNCRKKVHSGQTCTYCFRQTGDSGDLFTCSVCEGKIHKDCVRDYENCTPWCYLGVGLGGFRICVDCWVPELLKNSIKVSGRSESKGEAKNLLENAVKGSRCEVEKKVKTAPKANEHTLRRATVAKNVVDLVNSALDLSADKDKNSPMTENANCSGAVEVLDDAELAIQLHRAMNSSPRISRSRSLVNSNSLDVRNIREWNGLSYKRSALRKNQAEKLGTSVNSAGNEGMTHAGENDSCIGCSGLNLGLATYKRDKKRKIWQLNDESTVVSESRSSQQAEVRSNLHSDDPRTGCSEKSGRHMSKASIPVNADQSSSCTNVARFGQELLRYKRNRFKQKACQVNGLLGVSGECSSCDNHRGYCQSDDAKLRIGFPVKSDTEVILPRWSCVAERDRYHLKYGKRGTGTKSDSSFLRYATSLSENKASGPALSDSEYCQSDDAKLRTCCLVESDAEVILRSESCNEEQDCYHWKFGKRVTGTKSDSSFLHYSAFPSENQAYAPALSDSEYCQSDDAKVRTCCLVKSDAEVILPSESCNEEQDRYHWKFAKRVSGTKSDSFFLHYSAFPSENQASALALRISEAGYFVKCDGKLILPNGSSNQAPDRYRIKYAKRAKSSKSGSIADTKLHSDAFVNEVEASAPGLTTNCSAESRTLSDVSFDSFITNLPK